MTCVGDRRMDRIVARDDSPDNAAEEKAYIDGRAAYAKRRAARSGDLLPHVGTRNAALDMEMIRIALGEPKLHYFGFSYGTWLGGAYAHRFPDRVGRTVLDGAVDTEISSADLALQQAAALYSRVACPYLVQGLVDASERRDGTLLLMLADIQNGRDEDGTYTNLAAANTAIACADSADRYTPADVRRLLPKFRGASPVFGTSMAWGLLRCTGWPVEGDDAAREVSAPSAAPILVVGTTGDPVTPYAWAAALTRELGGRATFLTLDGDGHGAYDTGDPCVRRTVNAYLLRGVVPDPGKTCG